MAQRLYVGGLPFSTSSESLRALFADAGAVESVTVIIDPITGQSRGFGFVEMASAEEADAALKRFNGHPLEGRQLKVEFAKPMSMDGQRRPSSRGSRW